MGDHREMKSNDQHDEIHTEHGRTGPQCPAADHHEHTDIHRIPSEAVKPDDDEVFGWVPGREGSLAGDVEISNAPEEHDPTAPQHHPSEHPTFATPRIH